MPVAPGPSRTSPTAGVSGGDAAAGPAGLSDALTRELAADVAGRVRALMPRALEDLAELVALPSVFDPKTGPSADCVRAADLVAAALRDAGLPDVRLVETPDGSTSVIGHRPAAESGPTVLLYAHYDVQPPGDDTRWDSPPFALTERDGRWYGRGAADCKGNLLAHLTALRAVGDAPAVGIKVIVEGSEEQGTGGLERFVEQHPDVLAADTIVICDSGNVAVGVPTMTTALRGMVSAVVRVTTGTSGMHSGTFGGATPDALLALVAMLATLHNEAGDVTITGLANGGVWDGEAYPEQQLRADAHVLPGVDLLGSGTVADQLWARPALTVIGVEAPPLTGAPSAVQPHAAVRLNLRVPPGVDPEAAFELLAAHLRAAAPWHAEVEVELEGFGAPFRASTEGTGYQAMAAAMALAYGRPVTTAGQGGAIPLCNTFAQTYPDAEIMLIGVAEPACLMHAPNESVAPSEIEQIALAEALFLLGYPTSRGARP
ncbi:dipeptidase [Frankia sp. AgB1.9]|uniref:dipeptidase n=1 Tax=unclassified Frankia TaxID=2632575 RepID=UPI0019317734|nr:MULTISPECIES: dipeptidase [unclassified Frankia]MBL7490337.1 dipeptidase [Frankia sp. AgW1.1]MBL7552771.1 dipeptidase [Frankia sp. AgB1.9]MBL7625344.1 dipeptidase [Frankia sp. AgB1.8]